MKKTTVIFFAGIAAAILLALSVLVAACGDGEKKFVKIEMAVLPETTYTVGESFSPEGGKINAVYSDDSKVEYSLTDDGVTYTTPDTSKAGQKRVFITYNGDTTSFAVTVKEKAPAPIVTSMEITAPTKTEYVLGETLSLDGGSASVTYEDGMSAMLPLGDGSVSVSVPDMNVVGPQTVTVTYGGKTAEFNIKVEFAVKPTAAVTSIVIKNKPALTEYEEGETFSAAGGVLTATYADGTKADVSLLYGGVTITGANTSTEGTKSVTVSFGEVQTSFEITVLPSGSSVSSENVVKVSWATRPDLDNAEYFIGDEFDITAHGGEITVTYLDGTEVTVPVTMRGVTVGSVDTSKSGNKTVRVSVGSRYVTFSVTILKVGGTVTFNGNYAGSINDEVRFAEGRLITEKTDVPVREGYTFRGWYKDENCTVPFEFNRVLINGDVSVYACWTEDASASYTVTYDLNYYGVRVQSYMQYVKEGETARRIYDSSIDNPVRSKFAFGGWYSDAECNTAYDFSSAINSDTVIYAKWTRTDTSVAEYRFEAEKVSLEGMEGPGASGTNAGVNMIVNDVTGVGASGGQYVSYLYKKGLTLNFYIAASEADNNATISFYIAADAAVGADITINPDNYQIKINGEVQQYGVITLTIANHSKFDKYIVITGVKLKAGQNHIEMITNNDVNPLGDGVGTYAGTAPVVDCIDIKSSAALTWDETTGLPAN